MFVIPRMRVIFWAALGGIILISLVGMIFIRPEIPQTDEFQVVEQQVIYNVIDAGTGDLDGNGQLDRWTTNHSAAQWIALNGSSTNTGLALGLAQDSNLPGLEQGELPVPHSKPVRFYMDDTRFVIDVESNSDKAVKGAITIPWNVETRHEGAAQSRVRSCDDVPKCQRAEFEVRGGGRVWIEPVPAPSDGFAVTIEFAPETDLAMIQIGALALQPPRHRFTYSSRDRHGLTLGDPDRDGAQDIFVSRGGARGELGNIEPDALDEWFEWDGTKFVEKVRETGIEKRGCPGRQTAWTDVNGDGLIDIYQVCGRSGDSGDDHFNRLYLQNADGRFTEAAEDIGLALSGPGSFLFFRHACPNAPEMMLWAPAKALELYVRGADGLYSKAWSLPRQGGDTDNIALGNLDRDCRWEAMVLSPAGNILVRPDPERSEPLDPAQFGLPEASADGMFIDVNGDGWLDFFSVPDGLRLGRADGGFSTTDVLDMSWLGNRPDLRFAWFDADLDGDPDLWVLKQNARHLFRPVRSIYNRMPSRIQDLMVNAFGRERLRSRYWVAILYENRLANGKIRTIDVMDAAGHRLPAGVPVEVKIRNDGAVRTEYHLTGETDSARMSQTRADVAVSLPEGGEIIDAYPVEP